MDLVRVFETYCTNNGLEFRYGSKSHLNLVQSTLETDDVFMLLFPVDRHKKPNDLGTKISKRIFTGRFLLVKNSNRDQHYFNEREQDQQDSKYTENIEPLITLHESIGNNILGCDYGYELELWKCIDAVDVLDANLDGIWCNYKITQDV